LAEGAKVRISRRSVEKKTGKICMGGTVGSKKSSKNKKYTTRNFNSLFVLQ
jgi:hypothetical protein